jgi:thiol-disulfide isomerase/thioredoxin
LIVAPHRWSLSLLFAALPFAICRQVAAQAVEIQFTDSSGRTVKEAVVQLLAHTSTIPLAVDTVQSENGMARVGVPTPRTSRKLYVVELCAKGYAPQFVTAPFGRFDTLRLAVRLTALEHDSTQQRGPCAGAPGAVERVSVTDTSTFVGLAAASNLEVNALYETYRDLLQSGGQHDTIEAHSYRGRIMAQLNHRVASARSGSERARAAHALLSFAFWTHTALDARMRTRVSAALPPGSRWWLSQPYVVGLWATQLLCAADVAGDLAELSKTSTTRVCMRHVLERMANSIDEPEIRSEAQSQLVRLAYLDADTAAAQSLLEQMLSETPNHPFTQQVASRYAPNRPLREGAIMPAFSFAALPDTTIRITNSMIGGHFTLIDFWGTWCGPCVGAMPDLHRIYKEYHDRGFEILSVAADESPGLVNNFRTTKWSMPWLNAFVEYKEGVKENAKLIGLGVVTFPRAVLVDPNGKIVAELGPGGEELAKVLGRVLGR